jgi:hypothetical protein
MAQNMTAVIEGEGDDKELVVRIKMQKPAPSSSGKTLVVASSRGNQQTEAVIDHEGNSHNITLGVNAYIKP